MSAGALEPDDRAPVEVRREALRALASRGLPRALRLTIPEATSHGYRDRADARGHLLTLRIARRAPALPLSAWATIAAAIAGAIPIVFAAVVGVAGAGSWGQLVAALVTLATIGSLAALLAWQLARVAHPAVRRALVAQSLEVHGETIAARASPVRATHLARRREDEDLVTLALAGGDGEIVLHALTEDEAAATIELLATALDLPWQAREG